MTPDQYAELVSSFVIMGRAGANADPRHPMRAAWENARRQIEEYQAEKRGSAS